MSTRTGSLALEARPERVFGCFADPRNLVMADNAGPVVERSTPPTGPGSWAVLKFDQLRLRVEYDTWEPSTKLTAVLRYSGIGSRNRVDRLALAFESAGDRTVVKYERIGGPWLNLPVIGDWLERRYWRNVERRVRSGVE